MLKSKKIKQISLIILLPLLGTLLMFVSPKQTHADISISGSTYHVTNGNDLWNLLSDSDNYWSGSSSWLNPKPSHTPPTNLNIAVDGPITLPSSSPNLYSGLTNVTVDFQNQPFYVESENGSTINVSSNSQASKLNIKNVNIQSPAGQNDNRAYYVYQPDGSKLTAIWPPLSRKYEFYTTSNGILFSANSSGGATATNPTIIYTNVNYNCPGDLTNNQPLTTNAIPVEFQGNNNFTTGTTANQLAQIPNIKVTSGTTTMAGNGINAFSYGLINPTNNQSFPIDVSSGATLNINNNSSRSQMFNFNHSSNPLQINNSGSLNLNNNGNSNVLSNGVTGVDLNNNGQASLTATTSIFNSATMGTARVNMDLASGSQTLLASKNNAPFSNQSPWGSGSLLKFHPNAKFLSYSGMTYSAGGLTNNKNSDIPVEFIGTGSGSNGYKINQFPNNVDSYNNLTPISSRFNPANTVMSSSDLTNFDANALP